MNYSCQMFIPNEMNDYNFGNSSTACVFVSSTIPLCKAYIQIALTTASLWPPGRKQLSALGPPPEGSRNCIVQGSRSFSRFPRWKGLSRYIPLSHRYLN